MKLKGFELFVSDRNPPIMLVPEYIEHNGKNSLCHAINPYLSIYYKSQKKINIVSNSNRTIRHLLE